MTPLYFLTLPDVHGSIPRCLSPSFRISTKCSTIPTCVLEQEDHISASAPVERCLGAMGMGVGGERGEILTLLPWPRSMPSLPVFAEQSRLSCVSVVDQEAEVTRKEVRKGDLRREKE